MKGQKTGGRQKGSLNKTTQEARELLEKVVFGELDGIGQVLKEMKSEDKAKYIDALNKLLQYILAKKTDITSGDNPIRPNLNILVDNNETAKQLREFIDESKINKCLPEKS